MPNRLPRRVFASRPFSSLAFASLSGALLLLPLAASAQPAGEGPPPGVPLTIHKVSSQVYWAQGGIGNAGFVIGPSGVVVVDSTISPAGGAELVKDIAAITKKPIVAVAITHGDMDHTGGLGAFAPGTPIYAQANAAGRMKAALAAGHSRLPASAMPNHTVGRSAQLVLGGLKVRMLHWAPAHTDGDLVVYFPDQKLAFVGDIFAMDQPRPLVHRESGGTSKGWIASATGIVALPATRFIVGHGEVQARPALEQRLRQAQAEEAQVTRLVREGASLARVEQETGDYPQPPGHKGPNFPAFSQVIYEELTGHD